MLLVVRPCWFDKNTKNLTLGFNMDSNYSSSKLTSFFFICASKYLFRISICLTPFEVIFPLLPFLYCYFHFFIEDLWCCITFFQLEGCCKTAATSIWARTELLYEVTGFLNHYLFSVFYKMQFWQVLTRL